MKQGSIGVTTENIFPVIKKFLYSDHEIFLRELVSNAVDATQKLRTLASCGEFNEETGEMRVEVKVDKDAGTLTVSDVGIGLDADEVDRYINQIAFSGAEDFLKRYKDTANNIIGHFGLGFYSAFMVAKRVVLRSKSYKDGATAIEWECDGSPAYTMRECDKNSRGTDVILYIDDEDKEFLEQERIEALLKKYCRFLPVPVICGMQKEWKDGKEVESDKPNVVNATEPIWMRKPSELKDEDYIRFYHELMPGTPDPMFWIHLNVDYPFTLTGILYFPKVNSGIDLQRNRIQLYCNSVYVTDQVEGVVPEFMTLMQGVIDSPDIPLNVSRSYLQADAAVKKISAYISKKVAEKLSKMYADDRKEFEHKWDDIEIFIDYGMLTESKFCDSALKFYLLKDSEEEYFGLDEYRKLTEAEQTEKSGTLVWLYATDAEKQYGYISAARAKGYSVLLMQGQLDSHIAGLLEQKQEKLRLVRVDAESVDRLIQKGDEPKGMLSTEQTDWLSRMFSASIPKMDKMTFMVEFDALDASASPAMLTQNEFMRRMKEMSAMQPGMAGIYGDMPDSYSFRLNSCNAVIKHIAELASEHLEPNALAMRSEMEQLEKEIEEIRAKASEHKESLPQTTTQNERLEAIRKQLDSMAADYAATLPSVRQIVDLALLRAGLLSGAALNEFVLRCEADLKK